MREYRLTEAEENFANIIWANEPIKSPDLVKLCEEHFQWKKSTTYTMLKRLESKKIFQNNNSMVTSLIKKDDFHGEQSKIFVEENFGGSLPRFLAAFTRKRELSEEEVQQLEQLILDHREEE
ncbi:MAG: BlaI/MecI/CopY family transcriptional regulator [Tissierellia bacterium]|nr:BlaI/MecI/CopY family transcriptional regulator [Tissierellia bacterium]